MHPLEVLAKMVASSECFVAVVLVAKGTFDLFGLIMFLHMTVQSIKPSKVGAAKACECPVVLLGAMFVEFGP